MRTPPPPPEADKEANVAEEIQVVPAPNDESVDKIAVGMQVDISEEKLLMSQTAASESIALAIEKTEKVLEKALAPMATHDSTAEGTTSGEHRRAPAGGSSLTSGEPGAHAVLQVNPHRIQGNVQLTSSAEVDATPQTLGLSVAAEVAPDVEELAEENNALKARLEQLEAQQQAAPEQPAAETEVVVARAVEPDEAIKRKRIIIASVLCILVVLIVGATIATLVMVLPNKDEQLAAAPPLDEAIMDENINPNAQQPQPVNSTTQRFQDLVAILEPTYGLKLQSPDQQQAIHWLANIDPAEMDLDQPALTNASSLAFEKLNERYVAVLLYFATQGWTWPMQANWMTAFPYCNFENIQCTEQEPRRIVELDFGRSQLKGTIPAQIGTLTKLTRCGISYNSLTGTVPTQMGRLTLLEDLAFGSNYLTGTLPSELGNLSNLWFFSSTGNKLTGTIPTEFGNMRLLERLFIGENDFSGPLPTEMDGIQLQKFHFHGNRLFGDANPLACTNAAQESGGDCLADIECSCCAFCCNATTCCTYGENPEGICKPHLGG